jgi:transporter family-2 protein
VAYGIELLGWFGVEKQPLEIRKIVGMAVAIAGIIIFKWT